jgi:hypothetical protein
MALAILTGFALYPVAGSTSRTDVLLTPIDFTEL